MEELKTRRDSEASSLSISDARKLLTDQPAWLRNQIEHVRGQGFPEDQLKALGAAVAAEACGDATRGGEVLAAVTAFLTHGVGCGCEECA